MRYIAKVLKNTLHEKFPDATEDELLKVRALTSCRSFHPVLVRRPGSHQLYQDTAAAGSLSLVLWQTELISWFPPCDFKLIIK